MNPPPHRGRPALRRGERVLEPAREVLRGEARSAAMD